MDGQLGSLMETMGDHPIFRDADDEVLMALSGSCAIRTYEPMDVILYPHEERKGLLTVLAGNAEVCVEDEVLEIVRPGEMIGFSSLHRLFESESGFAPANDAQVEVRALEKVQALFIPFDAIAIRWSDPSVREYLLLQITERLMDVYGSLAEQVSLSRRFGDREALVLRVQDLMAKNIVYCEPDTPVREAAARMTEYRVSSIIVSEGKSLKGIITERDIVGKVVAGNRSLDAPASEIMTPEPYTISRFSYYYDAFTTLLLKGVKHLPVVDREQVCGMISLSDLLNKKNEGMMKTIQTIEEADEESLPRVKDAIYAVFETLLDSKVPAAEILTTVTKLYDRLIKRAAEIAVSDVERATGKKPPLQFGLYMMGSAGREEQFMLTDQDHFLVYEDTDNQEHEAYFKLLGERIVYFMEAGGYARCKGLMMCSETDWRGSIQEWKSRVREWGVVSTNDQLLKAINFFSYRLVYGSEELHRTFEDAMEETLSRCKMFLYRLAEVERERPVTALGNPIRSLFRLEKRSIDMKKEILFPYHHGLQILSMIHGIISGTPFERLDALARKGAMEENFANDVKEAMNVVLGLYIRLKNGQSKRGEELSSILPFAVLSTREKEELIISMKVLKEMQNKIFFHFHMRV